MGLIQAQYNPQEAGDPLRVDRCPDCGYLLTGLPEQGICPECGVHYDSSRLIVLYGRTTMGALGPWAWWQVALAAPWLLVIVVLGLVLAYKPSSICSLVCPAVAWGIIGIIAYRWIRHWQATNELPAPEQLRLAPEGFGCWTGCGPCSLQPWQRCMHLRITKWRRNRYRLEIFAPHEIVPHYCSHLWLRFYFQSDGAPTERIPTRIEQWRSREKC